MSQPAKTRTIRSHPREQRLSSAAQLTVQNSPILPRHQAAGARLAGEALLTYGDVPAEYRAAQEGAVLFDVASRGAVEVFGPEAEAFLHRLTANTVKGLPVGGGNASLLLTGKGKVQHVFELVRSGEERYRLSTSTGCAEPLRAALDMYHFAEELELVDATDEHAPLELCGPGSAALAYSGRTICFGRKTFGELRHL